MPDPIVPRLIMFLCLSAGVAYGNRVRNSFKEKVAEAINILKELSLVSGNKTHIEAAMEASGFGVDLNSSDAVAMVIKAMDAKFFDLEKRVTDFIGVLEDLKTKKIYTNEDFKKVGIELNVESLSNIINDKLKGNISLFITKVIEVLPKAETALKPLKTLNFYHTEQAVELFLTAIVDELPEDIKGNTNPLEIYRSSRDSLDFWKSLGSLYYKNDASLFRGYALRVAQLSLQVSASAAISFIALPIVEPILAKIVAPLSDALRFISSSLTGLSDYSLIASLQHNLLSVHIVGTALGVANAYHFNYLIWDEILKEIAKEGDDVPQNNTRQFLKDHKYIIQFLKLGTASTVGFFSLFVETKLPIFILPPAFGWVASYAITHYLTNKPGDHLVVKIAKSSMEVIKSIYQVVSRLTGEDTEITKE